ncbi:hypothetical protein B0H67DRAFT_631840 [Lasiosphaeris hirsuta]|uniref:DUF4470 domain-containing protein n=1 Tax=Lasiosphaeris hirsuta TaxID=260670 RepID=A0AA40BD75_9PEZI|nr:hypothetical protein B0H67DRAFT_631840 [Lasiosphaeris hirsuta]
MAPDDAAARAEAARKRGNELYKQGKLAAAEVEYKRAAVLAPDDPSPLSNLSSVKLELGQYAVAILYIQKYLKLAGDVGADEAAVRKKNVLNEHLLSNQTLQDSARNTLDSLGLWRLSPDSTSRDAVDHRRAVFDRLPRYQACLDNVPEYYAIGHDMAETLFDDSPQKSSSPQDSVSLMFCGSGDARNVFMTIAMFFFNELIAGKKFCRDIHITLLDLKPAAIARTLIFFDLMAMYGKLGGNKDPKEVDLPVIMAYLYAGHVIPAAVNDMLQSRIGVLLDVLETNKKIFDWFFVPSSTRKEIAYVLRQWKNPPKANWYSTPVIRRTVRQRLAVGKWNSPIPFIEDDTPPGFRNDRKSFDELPILLPSKSFAKKHDTPLVALMEQYRAGSKNASKRLADHVDESWVTNLTLIDFDHAEALHRNGEDELLGWTRMRDDDMVPSIESDPSAVVAGSLPQASKGGVLEAIGLFFKCAASPLTVLPQRLKIEALVGEMTDTVDRLRWGLLESRSQPSGGIDPSKFLQKYDRIYMSNIPDYIGGPLTAALYACPLLREDRLSNLQFTVLLNSPSFSSHEEFQAEYMLMHEMKQISDHFSVTRISNPTTERDPEKMAFLKMTMNLECPSKKLLRGDGMLPRPALEKWLHALFLKICILYSREKFESNLVY